jgi:hypothetical protein
MRFSSPPFIINYLFELKKKKIIKKKNFFKDY